MGDKDYFQPLTRQDRITVIIYRAGILLSSVIICLSAFLVVMNTFSGTPLNYPAAVPGIFMETLLLMLYFSVGMSVFFIHLYIGKFHRILKKVYYVSLSCLALLFFIGNGNPVIPFFRIPPYSALFLIPLSLCLGFITAKEAFCFKLFEGYILAIIMPAYIFFYAVGISTSRGSAIGFSIVASLLVIFTFRTIFMPIHYDIGDKSAYQP
jgi:uncharacterized integral membrane protein